MSRHLRLIIFALGTVMAGALAHAEYPEQQGMGVIEDIDLEKSTLIADGLRFRVAIDAKVTINGSYGAFTLLQKGMLIRYRYWVISPREREIFELETRPPNEPFESS